MRSIVAAVLLLTFCATSAIALEVVTRADGKTVVQMTTEEATKLDAILGQYRELLERAVERIDELERENAELRRKLRDRMV